MFSKRPAAVTATVVALAALMACSDQRIPRAQLASAECLSAVHDRLGLVESDTSLRGDGMQVTDRKPAGSHVEGRWTADTGSGDFTCDVVPDASNALRGLRVAALEVTRAP